jgi:hypothetical protein
MTRDIAGGDLTGAFLRLTGGGMSNAPVPEIDPRLTCG